MGPSTGSARPAREAQDTARRAEQSRWLDRLARLGYAARGITYLLVGYFALQIAFGGSSRKASRNGAFHAIADKSWGPALLWVMAIGFFGMALWRLTEVIAGHNDADSGGKKAAGKAYSGLRALIYGFIGYSAASLASGSGGSSGSGGGSSAREVTAQLMKKSYGVPLLIAAGVVIIGIGAALAWQGISMDYDKHFKTDQMSHRTRTLVKRAGTAGMVARGTVVALIGIFVIQAAATFDPKKAKGLDGSLRTLAHSGWGKVLLVLVALGLLAFGVYSLLEVRYRRIGDDGAGATGRTGQASGAARTPRTRPV